MVTIQVKNINGSTVLPVAGSSKASGYDIIAIDDPKIIGEVAGTKEVDGKEVTFYRRVDWVEYKTGLFIAPQPNQNKNYHTLVLPRSSVRKYDLVLANSIGLIDNDYRGEILFCFKYIWQPDTLSMETVKSPVSDGSDEFRWDLTGRILGVIDYDRIYKKGDKLGQLLADERNSVEFSLVTELDQTVRGQGGFGSTDITPTPKVKEENPKDAEGALKAFKTIVDNIPGKSLTDLYQKGGGIPVRKRYSEEIKERKE